MYKLIKFKVDGNCLTPCPYGLIGVGRIMVYSASCNECKHNKGKVKKQVKCSFEYDTKEPSEIKTGKVTSSDCACKEEVEKSCNHWWIYTQLMVNPVINKRKCSICGVEEYEDDFGEYREPKQVADEKPKSEKVRSHETSCMYCRHLAEKEPCNSCFKGDKFEPPKPKVEKVKKLKLKITKTKYDKIQEALCEYCVCAQEEERCNTCEFNLDRYIVKEKHNAN
jgi:hypothetical protein